MLEPRIRQFWLEATGLNHLLRQLTPEKTSFAVSVIDRCSTASDFEQTSENLSKLEKREIADLALHLIARVLETPDPIESAAAVNWLMLVAHWCPLSLSAHSNLLGGIAAQKSEELLDAYRLLNRAIEHYKTSDRIGAGEAVATYYLARSLALAGDFKKSAEHFKRAKELIERSAFHLGFTVVENFFGDAVREKQMPDVRGARPASRAHWAVPSATSSAQSSDPVLTGRLGNLQ
jgi:hypothetical protein